jgi:hypothetical protein
MIAALGARLLQPIALALGGGPQPVLQRPKLIVRYGVRLPRQTLVGTPQASQDFSGVPHTHQYVVTLTAHTDSSNPTIRPTRPSATSMKNRHPVVVSREAINSE